MTQQDRIDRDDLEFLLESTAACYDNLARQHRLNLKRPLGRFLVEIAYRRATGQACDPLELAQVMGLSRPTGRNTLQANEARSAEARRVRARVMPLRRTFVRVDADRRGAS
jgi:hypothetical protein